MLEKNNTPRRVKVTVIKGEGPRLVLIHVPDEPPVKLYFDELNRFERALVEILADYPSI